LSTAARSSVGWIVRTPEAGVVLPLVLPLVLPVVVLEPVLVVVALESEEPAVQGVSPNW
jgi:hypothetical protein